MLLPKRKLTSSVVATKHYWDLKDKMIMTETILAYVIALTVLVLFYSLFWHNRSARERAHMDAETKRDEGLRPKHSS